MEYKKFVCIYLFEYLNLLEILTLLYDSLDFAAMHQVECIDLVHIQAVEAMVTDMMMIVMEAGRKIEMAMAIEMMTAIVVMEIVMVEIMRSVTAGTVTEMMTTGEEVEVLITNMKREAGARIEIVMMMMDNTHLGMNLYDKNLLLFYGQAFRSIKHDPLFIVSSRSPFSSSSMTFLSSRMFLRYCFKLINCRLFISVTDSFHFEKNSSTFNFLSFLGHLIVRI